ncbi:MAG TPA: hypothetical protein VKF32_03250 [Thermoanaerobaculia bacterium]|nr:hypothetical protein [Thermoanaerobaculia bacterium]
MSAIAVSLSDVALRRRAEYRRQVGRRLTEIDGALDLLKERLRDADGSLLEHGRKLVTVLADRRKNLDGAVEELMRAPEEEWTWQKREIEDARERLFDLVDAALAEYVLGARF